ncbi:MULTISPECIES: hypothetical protein [Nocardioides]|nr:MULTISPECIES: hypothetical protein [unclassified Nocardioides]
MTCTHRLAGDSLTCDRTTPHDPDAAGGHTYTSTSAGDAEPGGDY